MKSKLIFESGIVEGRDMRDAQEVFPELENSFTQRKTYDEYYYTETEVELISIAQLMHLEGYFDILITDNQITLK